LVSKGHLGSPPVHFLLKSSYIPLGVLDESVPLEATLWVQGFTRLSSLHLSVFPVRNDDAESRGRTRGHLGPFLLLSLVEMRPQTASLGPGDPSSPWLLLFPTPHTYWLPHPCGLECFPSR
jgi:hypothetical protein